MGLLRYKWMRRLYLAFLIVGFCAGIGFMLRGEIGRGIADCLVVMGLYFAHLYRHSPNLPVEMRMILKMKKTSGSPKSQEEAQTYDYTEANRRWGHNCFTMKVIDGGRTLKLYGFGHRMVVGDYLIMSHKTGETTRYQIEEIEYKSDPPDMWIATVKFAPRPPS